MSKSEKQLTHIGKIIDAHGIRGEIYCHVFSGDTSWISKAKTLTLNSEKFQILKIKPHKKGFIALLEGFKDRNRAEEFKGVEVWVDSSFFVSETGEEIYLTEIENFKVQDEKIGDIGTVTGFSFNGMQDLLVVTQNKKSYEIPFVEEFVVDIDYENQVIQMDLPEGLLQINEKDNAKN